jgi:hypothetical protein
LRAEFARTDSHSLPRPERDFVKHPAILLKGNLIFGSSIEIVEDYFRKTVTCPSTEIIDIDNTGGSDVCALYSYLDLGANTGKLS